MRMPFLKGTIDNVSILKAGVLAAAWSNQRIKITDRAQQLAADGHVAADDQREGIAC